MITPVEQIKLKMNFFNFCMTSKREESNIQVSANNKASKPIPHIELATNMFPHAPVFNSISSSLPYVKL